MRILSPTYRPSACSRGLENITGFPGTAGKMEFLSFISSKMAGLSCIFRNEQSP